MVFDYFYSYFSVAALVIVEQPFPMVVTKGKQMDEDPVLVQLLGGANVEFTSFSKVCLAHAKTHTLSNIAAGFIATAI